jgi:putative transcription factor
MEDNNNWITVEKKQKPKNNDVDIPVSFAKIKEERKKATQPPKIVSKTGIQNKKKNIETNNILNKIDEGTYIKSTISHTLSSQIIKARQEKGWTQKEFATLCNLNIAVIKGYESGVGHPKNIEMNRMSSVLGIALHNK